jgi:hypothetical protein
MRYAVLFRKFGGAYNADNGHCEKHQSEEEKAVSQAVREAECFAQVCRWYSAAAQSIGISNVLREER